MNSLLNNRKTKFKFLVIIFCTIGLLYYYLDPVLFFLIEFVGFIIIFVFSNVKISFFKYGSLLLFLMIDGLIIGVFQILLGNTSIRDVIRDVFYYINPIVYIMFFKLMFKITNMQEDDFLKIIIYMACMYVIIEFLSVGVFLLTNNTLNFNEYRTYISGITIIPIALAILLSPIRKRLCLTNFVYGVLLILFGLELIISFSRSGVLIFLIFFIFLNRNKNILRMLLYILIGFFIFYLVISLIDKEFISVFTNKFLNSLKEISPFNDWSQGLTVIQTNWRGYESYCAIKQNLSGNIFQSLFGYGSGARIYVGPYAQLVDTSASESIAVLHNGYSTILVKNGIIGFFVYLLYYIFNISLYWNKKKNSSQANQLYLCTFITLLIMTIFLNGLFKDLEQIAFMMIIGFYAKPVKVKTYLKAKEQAFVYKEKSNVFSN